MGECICERGDPKQEAKKMKTSKLRKECGGSMIMGRRVLIHETTSGRAVDIRRIQRRPPAAKRVVMWSVTIIVLQKGAGGSDSTQTLLANSRK